MIMDFADRITKVDFAYMACEYLVFYLSVEAWAGECEHKTVHELTRYQIFAKYECERIFIKETIQLLLFYTNDCVLVELRYFVKPWTDHCFATHMKRPVTNTMINE